MLIRTGNYPKITIGFIEGSLSAFTVGDGDRADQMSGEDRVVNFAIV